MSQRSLVLTRAPESIIQRPLVSLALLGQAQVHNYTTRLLHALLMWGTDCGQSSSGPCPALLALKEQLFAVLSSNCLQPLELSQPRRSCLTSPPPSPRSRANQRSQMRACGCFSPPHGGAIASHCLTALLGACPGPHAGKDA